MSKISEYTESLKDIQEFLTELTNVIQIPTGLLIIALFIIWVIITKDFTNLFNLFERKTNKRLELIEKYISNPDPDDKEALKAAQDQRSVYYFKVTTNGIYAEKKLRNKLIELHENSSAKINWTMIRRALRFIEIADDGSIYIKEKTLTDKFGIIYVNTLAVLLFLSAISIAAVHLLLMDTSFIETMKMIAYVICCIISAIFMISQKFPRRDADRIAKEIETIKLSKTNID